MKTDEKDKSIIEARDTPRHSSGCKHLNGLLLTETLKRPSVLE